jgi:hypothetical protein
MEPSLPRKDYNATMIELALGLMGMQRISLLLAHVMWHSDLSGLDDKKNCLNNVIAFSLVFGNYCPIII